MLKKYICLVLAIAYLFFITACSEKNIQAETTFDFLFADEIGNLKEDVFDNLDISGEQVTSSKLQGRYDLTKLITYYGADFTKYLLFYKTNEGEMLYGVVMNIVLQTTKN